ncbi:sugar ABC transporter substrate-binding protein [[Clostridium] fimetarium]|uniref:Maltose-binding protein MalE n=1 Tax=[Clostridium] fimetarium TaxID=99656 RepID=A0A1I0MR82_9FIRM|nr:hypothetical protein [[Clostridium] fimetarium]SEV90694.1 Maltose-binding protein MalE [[Clostridium] fimetarium]
MVSVVRKITVLLLVAVMVTSCVACSSPSTGQETKDDVQQEVTLNLWYTDNGLTDYLLQVAKEYHESNQLVTIVPTVVAPEEYLENLYNGSIKEQNATDLFMLSSDNLEKAYLMGLVASNDTYKATYTDAVYGKAGIAASSYDNKLLGYPLTFNTTVMVYNSKYAKAVNTFTDLTNYNNSYQHTDENAEVEYIVKWDVANLFTNYAFLGSYMNIGGASSDDKSVFQLNANSMKACLGEYLKFKTDYGIITDPTSSPLSCMTLFRNNKLIYTLANTSELKNINDSGVQYGICKIPDLTSSLKTNALSTTQMMVVNPYSKNVAAAKSAAKAMTYDYANEFYKLAGNASARSDLDNYPSPEYSNLYNIYSNSIVKAQFINIGDFYLNLEIMLHQVWNGTSIEDSFNTLNNYVTTQLMPKTTSSK